MKTRLFLLAACLFATVRAEPELPAAAEVAAEAPEFIRVEETDKGTELQTAVVRFTKGKAAVDLVGAVHIADKKYYKALGKRFESYQALLYEGIGGGNPAPPASDEVAKSGDEEPGADGAAGVKPKKKGNLDGLHAAYESGAKWLELSYQMKEIDYTKANFVHADLTMAEFQKLQEKRGETLLGFVLKTGMQADTSKVKQPSAIKLLTSLVTGNKNGLKRELVHSLGAGDDQVASLAGESVIISDRNAKCLEVLAREVTAGKKKLGIFYGAAHFPDMEKRLLEAGWAKAGTEWMTAWEIGK